MSKFLKKRFVLMLMALSIFVVSFVSFIFGSPKTYAAEEILLDSLTLSDIRQNTTNLNSIPQGTKGVWRWKGIKSVNSNSISAYGNGEDNWYFHVSIDEEADIENVDKITRIEWKFTTSVTTSAVRWFYGNNYDILYGYGAGSHTITLTKDDFTKQKYNDFIFTIDYSRYNPVPDITDYSIKLYYTPGGDASITAGKGIKSTYLSKDQNATSGSASGTSFDDGDTVYGFVKLKAGFKHDPNWTLVSGNEDTEDAIYRVGSKTIDGDDVDFGTLNAIPFKYPVSITGGTGVDEVYLSTNSTATSGYPTGTEFDCESVVYGFAKVKKGYKPASGWALIDGNPDEEDAIYRVGSITVSGQNNYDTFNLKDELDIAQSNNAILLIDAIGTVEYTPESKALIDTARSFYDSLSTEGKALVTNYNTLLQAEAAYNALDDNYKANQVKELINNIGEVKYNNDTKTKIDNAKTAYDDLSNEGKALVTNYQVLTHDIEVYNHVDDVYKKIEAINEVKYDTKSEEEIGTARAAYDGLTDEEKELITNYEKLTNDEKNYSDLKNNHKVFVGWMVTLGVMGGFILALVIAYCLFFFVFNKWTLINGNPARVFVIGKKNGKVRLLNMTLMIIYREENEVFNKKEELVK